MGILANRIQGLHYLILSFKNCKFDLSCYVWSLRLLMKAELAFGLRVLSEEELQSCGLLDKVGTH